MVNTYANLSDNLPDLRLKSHVEHAVGFIDHQVGGSAQVRLVVFKQVNQSAGRCNTDLGP